MAIRQQALVLAGAVVLVALACSGGNEACTQELGVELPSGRTIAPGESFTAKVRLSSCGGREHPKDNFIWRAQDPRVVSVDSTTGRITGQSHGSTQVEVEGREYGALGSISVTVR
jgi:hypothetical protein